RRRLRAERVPSFLQSCGPGCEREQPAFSPRLERIPIRFNRHAPWIHLLSHVLFGKPVSTFPGHALSPGPSFSCIVSKPHGSPYRAGGSQQHLPRRQRRERLYGVVCLFEREPGRRTVANLTTKDEARRIAANTRSRTQTQTIARRPAAAPPCCRSRALGRRPVIAL